MDMPFILLYCIKLSLGLAIVWLFYQLVLRKLTFYNWNRIYLLVYTLFCFYIPFIDISSMLEQNEWDKASFVQWVPVVYDHSGEETNISSSTSFFTTQNILLLLLLAGMAVLLLRLLVQFISFRRLLKKAEFISGNGMKIYRVNEQIIPFSFGNSIFINPSLHSESELQEIIRHEFVHVKQRHSIDIIWGEVLCLLNWYNPFAWLLKRAVRQNLEFIADNKVLENGINKKDYQYLLLKVIGNTQFSIANQFNFSSLKKRIAMMNKLKTTRVHLVKFLLALPVLAIILLSFRKQIGDTLSRSHYQNDVRAVADTVPEVKLPNEKGYYIDIKDKNGNCELVIRDKDKKEVKRLLLTEWSEKIEYYEGLYGLIPPPPPSVPVPPVKTNLPENVESIHADNDKVTVTLKDGKKENYDFTIESDKAAFERKYGKLPPPPPPPPAPVIGVTTNNLDKLSDNYEITDKKATIHLRSGKTEVYDLTNEKEIKAFESKYGKIIRVNTNVNTNINASVAPVTAVTVEGKKITTAPSPAVIATGVNVQSTSAAPVTVVGVQTTTNDPVKASGVQSIHAEPVTVQGVKSTTAPSPSKTKGGVNTVLAPINGLGEVVVNGYPITGKEVILVKITKNTTRQELDDHIKKMKEKGVELVYDEVSYNDKGELVMISGTMKSKDGRSNFVATDFETLTLSLLQHDYKTYFKVKTTDKKTVI